ncbi:MAG: S-layer homology domain-containing protein, partial [Oscillibacter sp.]|nr:S-layer homology domain-containing protein [Oscillibacter sp.]
AWASANGIVNGYSDGTFRPNNPITREQMAAFLYRYAGYKGRDISARADLNGYLDAAQIAGYAVEPIQWANAQGLINGTSSTTLSPTGNATRAQVAVILTRFAQNVVQ